MFNFIQDNFNLKEENARLRQRMLDLERQMGELRRENQGHLERFRQEFEIKLMQMREITTRAKNPITILQTRSGCLGSLFGGKGTVQTIQQAQQPPEAAPLNVPRQQSPRNHPRPPGPPE